MMWDIPLRAAAVAGLLALAACASTSAPDPAGDAAKAPPPAVVPRAAEAALAPKDPIDALTLEIDKARETGRWRDGELVIDRVPPALIPAYLRWFEPRARDFPPLWIYASARKFAEGREYVKAAFWYFAARERHLRQVRRCRDTTVRDQIVWADAAFESLRRVLGKQPELTRYAAKHAFAWLDLNPDTEAGLLDACLSGTAGAERAKDSRLVPVVRDGRQIYVLTPPPVKDKAKWLIPAAEVYEPRIWSRILMKQDIAKILDEPAEEPPVEQPTPLR